MLPCSTRIQAGFLYKERAEQDARYAFQTITREELSRIASVKFKKALSDCARAVSPRVLAFCVMVVCLMFTLTVTAANLRLTYVADSTTTAVEQSGIYYTAFSGDLASLSIDKVFSVTIQADGQEYPVKMVYGTVADALNRAGITLDADDYTEPALDQNVSMGDEIIVHRVDYLDRVETQAIPYETSYVYTSLYFRNTKRATTLQNGSEGQQTITTRDRYVDGELENSVVVDVTTTVEPVDHIIKTYGAGAPVSPLTGPDGTTNAPSSYKKVLTGKVLDITRRAARALRVWVWATARSQLTPMSSPMARCSISFPPTAASCTVMRSLPIQALRFRTVTFWSICSMRRMLSRSSMERSRSMFTL